MATYKCANILYADETMTLLNFVRSLTIAATTTKYLRAVVSTADWQFTNGSTTLDQTITAGSKKYDFPLQYTPALPGGSGKYSLAVAFNWYSDAGYTNLIKTDNHTFEFHFYHFADFAARVHDHISFDGSLDSDNGILTAATTLWRTTATFVDPLIEGTGCLYFYGDKPGYDVWGYVTVSNIPANVFLIFAYKGGSTDTHINGVYQTTYSDSVVRKVAFHTVAATTLLQGVVKARATTGNAYVDAVYTMTEIP